MRIGIVLFLLAFCVSCASDGRRLSPRASSLGPKAARDMTGSIRLPKISVDEDGVALQEAVKISSRYFRAFINGCGMPDKPEDCGDFWGMKVWVGFVAAFHGTLWIAKDGSGVWFWPLPKYHETYRARLL
jgi:hypothetical protein